MIYTQVTQIRHSTVGSSFRVSFSADPTPNDLEVLRAMRDGFMRWNNSGVSFTTADTPQTDDKDTNVLNKSQTDLSAEEFVEGMKNLKMEVKQTDCGWGEPK